jgi:hypothetical protein
VNDNGGVYVQGSSWDCGMCALKVEAACWWETLVFTDKVTWFHNPEGLILIHAHYFCFFKHFREHCLGIM